MAAPLAVPLIEMSRSLAAQMGVVRKNRPATTDNLLRDERAIWREKTFTGVVTVTGCYPQPPRTDPVRRLLLLSLICKEMFTNGD